MGKLFQLVEAEILKHLSPTANCQLLTFENAANVTVQIIQLDYVMAKCSYIFVDYIYLIIHTELFSPDCSFLLHIIHCSHAKSVTGRDTAPALKNGRGGGGGGGGAYDSDTSSLKK